MNFRYSSTTRAAKVCDQPFSRARRTVNSSRPVVPPYCVPPKSYASNFRHRGCCCALTKPPHGVTCRVRALFYFLIDPLHSDGDVAVGRATTYDDTPRVDVRLPHGVTRL